MGISVRGAAVSAVVAALVAGVATIGALTAPAATAAPHAAPVPAGPRWAPAATAAIRPGVLTETAGAGACTSNFVFTSGGRVLLGQAAHCAGTGDASEVDGCEAATRPVGTAVTIRADGGDRRATLVYSSWVTMQAVGETDPAACAYNDFALVELAPADAADVHPGLPGLGGPTGLDVDGLVPGETVHTYGRVPAGGRTLAPKTGTSAPDVGAGWGHEVRTLEPGAPGDSGSPFVDAGGRAVGVLSTLNVAPQSVSTGGTDLARAMAYAAERAGFADLALVNGTEPFAPGDPSGAQESGAQE